MAGWLGGDVDAVDGSHEKAVHGELLVLPVSLLHHVGNAVLAHAAQALDEVLHGAVPLVLPRPLPVQQYLVAHLRHRPAVGQRVEPDTWHAGQRTGSQLSVCRGTGEDKHGQTSSQTHTLTYAQIQRERERDRQRQRETETERCGEGGGGGGGGRATETASTSQTQNNGKLSDVSTMTAGQLLVIVQSGNSTRVDKVRGDF